MESPVSKFSSLIPKNLSASKSSSSSLSSTESSSSSFLLSLYRALILRCLNKNPLMFAWSFASYLYFLVFFGASYLILLMSLAYLSRTRKPLIKPYIFAILGSWFFILLISAVYLIFLFLKQDRIVLTARLSLNTCSKLSLRMFKM
jgi:hypothetical protein